eukprot:NODE_3640_length_1314_cov_75.424013_g3185_i0.p1 GENE.NODE_3640_length_1314_cov_75.424013_g3185_i0~~NODE_3640_length_1314_cov_75.424013_g3185_i0.p1  ORF type:complete len:377 (+),score=43.38 NODE_3640_length_1314_cov_75.424013_g3185_i0:70-1131(+)
MSGPISPLDKGEKVIDVYEPPPAWRVTFLKVIFPALLCVEFAAYTLLRRYTKGVLLLEYSSSTVLGMAEVIKFGMSAFMVTIDTEPSDSPRDGVMKKYWWLLVNSSKMVVPAVIFLIMNILTFGSLARIDAGTFTAIAQLKILSTALMMLPIMRKSVSWRRWRALLILTLSVTLISYQARPKSEGTSEKQIADLGSFVVGIILELMEVILSGFSTVYVEKVLKSSDQKQTVWERNFQLAFYSMFIYFGIAYQQTTMQGIPMGTGWDWSVMLVAFLGAMAGILVALSLKYTDSIVKTLATSGAILLTTLFGWIYLSGPLDFPILLGSGIVIISLLNYQDDGSEDKFTIPICCHQ